MRILENRVYKWRNCGTLCNKYQNSKQNNKDQEGQKPPFFSMLDEIEKFTEQAFVFKIFIHKHILIQFILPINPWPDFLNPTYLVDFHCGKLYIYQLSDSQFLFPSYNDMHQKVYKQSARPEC